MEVEQGKGKHGGKPGEGKDRGNKSIKGRRMELVHLLVGAPLGTLMESVDTIPAIITISPKNNDSFDALQAYCFGINLKL